MRKDDPRDSAALPRPAVKRAAPVTTKTTDAKKKKQSETVEAESPSAAARKKLLKPKVVLTKLPPGCLNQQAKAKTVKETKPPKSAKPPVKTKPKKVIVSKETKKVIKVENDQKKASTAKIVQPVKDLKNAKNCALSKIKKEPQKKLSNSTTIKKIPGGSINVVKKHNIVKRVNKMSGKKPCVVSVKISNAHSTVTLSVKQNKQVNKKDSTKGMKSGSGKSPDRNTISIVKKGIASRRKSTSKESSFHDSSPSSSPIRDDSPVRIKEEKNSSQMKKSDGGKNQKKVTKPSSNDSNKCSDEKFKEKIYQNKAQDDSKNGKTEVFINDSVKIKTENVGENQNMEIEFTNDSIKDQGSDRGNDCKDTCKSDGSLVDFKAKSSSNEYSNLKSIDSSTSDEMPLEILKSKQKVKQEKDLYSKSYELSSHPKIKKEKDSFKAGTSETKNKVCNSKQAPGNKKSEVKKQPKAKIPERMSKAALKKLDQESVAKLKSASKKKNIALKQKIAKLVKSSRLNEQKQNKTQEKDEAAKSSDSDNSERKRKKLLKFWNGPKRHRVASLNAIAKVHCLYENESRGALNEMMSSAAALQRAIQESKRMAGIETSKNKPKKLDNKEKKKPTAKEKRLAEPTVVRSLRTNPGVRSVGRNFDILNVISSTSLSSSSSEESCDSGEEKKQLALLPTLKQKQLLTKQEECEQTSDEEVCKKVSATHEDSKDGIKKMKKRRRKRNELTMDLKDMVVRKRMASLNASAIMTATYSSEKKLENIKMEKRKEEESVKKKRKKLASTPKQVDESSGEEEDVIVRTTNNKQQKVAVIVNQDTDVTITGVYVNSTTRSTHHEGFCSIAGLQYRISSTSHTQTEATAVATETVQLHTDHVSHSHIYSVTVHEIREVPYCCAARELLVYRAQFTGSFKSLLQFNFERV